MLHIKFQLKVYKGSGEKNDFIGFAIFSIDGHLGFLTRLNFIILKPCSLVTLHLKFENRI